MSIFKSKRSFMTFISYEFWVKTVVGVEGKETSFSKFCTPPPILFPKIWLSLFPDDITVWDRDICLLSNVLLCDGNLCLQSGDETCWEFGKVPKWNFERNQFRSLETNLEHSPSFSFRWKKSVFPFFDVQQWCQWCLYIYIYFCIYIYICDAFYTVAIASVGFSRFVNA